jgi:hypothetical protein
MECSRKVAVAREAKVCSQARQVIASRQKLRRSREPYVQRIAIEADFFDSAKRQGQRRRRRTQGACGLRKPRSLLRRLQQILRQVALGATDQLQCVDFAQSHWQRLFRSPTGLPD